MAEKLTSASGLARLLRLVRGGDRAPLATAPTPCAALPAASGSGPDHAVPVMSRRARLGREAEAALISYRRDHIRLLTKTPAPTTAPTFARALARLTPEALPALDVACRRELMWTVGGEQPGGRRARLRAALARAPELAPLLSMDCDGYPREAATKLLPRADMPMASALALAVRTNDWVPAARTLAVARLGAALERLEAGELQRLVPLLLDRLPDWTRGGPAMTAKVLSQPRVLEAAARHLRAEREGPLARRAQILLRAPEFDPHLPDLATGARAGAVRALALATLLRGEARWPEGWTWVWVDKPYMRQVRRRAFASRRLSAPDPRPLLAAGAADRSPAVRRVVADAVIALGPEALAPELLDWLRRDRTAPVAERMAFFDRKWTGRRAAPEA